MVLSAPKFLGAAIQPAVNLNGEKVGISKPGGFFFIDRAPGDYEVIMPKEVDKKLSFQLDAGDEKYVRMAVGLGVVVYRVFPELADSSEANTELQKLSFIENPTE